MTIYHLFVTVIGALLLFLIVRNVNEKYSVFITVSGAIALLLFICTELFSVFSFIKELGNQVHINNKYFSVVLKGLTVCYLGEFTASICKDCGQTGWGDKVEVACRCTLLVIAIPLFKDFLDVITRLME